MSEGIWAVAVAVLAIAVVTAAFFFKRQRRQSKDEERLAKAKEQNLHLPLSLHPVIDPDICIGSYSCLSACPEGDILGIVSGKPELVSPSHCIGHGKCAAECPVKAIKLVFGSSERGLDLPEISEYFESSRPGVHIVGELGGMGLIKNAMTQGVQVAKHLGAKLNRIKMAKAVDVVIVGAGPAGLATALGCQETGLTYTLLEQGAFGGTVSQYPRHKVVMTEPVKLPFVGNFGKRTISKESLLKAWKKMADKARLKVHEGVQVTAIEGNDNTFTVLTSKGPYYGRKVVLATGRRGTPRKLGCDGDTLPKVSYGLIDPEQYDGCRVMVVGGGDSAMEAAIQLAEESSADVTICYRGEALGRGREANRKRLSALEAKGKVKVLLSTTVKSVQEQALELQVKAGRELYANDYVIACLGGEVPSDLLSRFGVKMKQYFGTGLGETSKGPTVPRGAAKPPLETEKDRRFVRILWIAGAAIFVGLWLMGWNYYPLTHAERLKSPLHALLKPAGKWGHGVGIVSTGVMFTNFFYAARKRWKLLKGAGSIKRWLDVHAFVGLMTPLVIAFHAAFQSNNVLATSTAASLAVVVVTGLLGRYLYALVPKQEDGEVPLVRLRTEYDRLKGRLEPMMTALHHTKVLNGLIQDVETDPQIQMGGTLLLDAPTQLIRTQVLLARSRGLFEDKGQYSDFVSNFRKLTRVKLQVSFYRRLKGILGAWRVLHVALAIFLSIMIAAHIGVSLYLGYGLDFFRMGNESAKVHMESLVPASATSDRAPVRTRGKPR